MSKRVSKPKTMWHPSFVSSLQIELQEYYHCLQYTSELNLNKAPRRIDAVVIVLLKEITFTKNIALIFRKYNVFEYKSPEDNLTVNDYYNGLSYAFQYKSIEEHNVSIDSLTLSFVCMKRPEELFTHLIERQYRISNGDRGIYYIKGNQIPIQVIVSNELDESENMHLNGLRKGLDDGMILRLIHSKSDLPDEIYTNYIEAVSRANLERFWEVSKMNAMMKEIYSAEEWKALNKKAEETIKILGFDKKWDEELKQKIAEKVAEKVAEARRDNEKALQKERRAKERALQKERLAKEEQRRAKEEERLAKEEERRAKEELEILRNRITELERLAQEKQQ